MTSLLEPFAALAVAGDMRSAGGALLSPGPSSETVLASVSPSSVALVRVEDSRPVRSWFTKPTAPFTTTAVWDPLHSKIVSASHGKVLSWTNSEKATPAVIVECPSEVLCLLPGPAGVVVVCRNGLVFRLAYDRPNWSVQLTPVAKGVFSWAAAVADHVFLLSEDGRSVTRLELPASGDASPDSMAASRTLIKTPNAKFVVAACCVQAGKVYVGNSQGRVMSIDGDVMVSTKIDLKLDSSSNSSNNSLAALVGCSDDMLLVASHNKVSMWDIPFGLMKACLPIAFTPWTNKCLMFNSKALFVSANSLQLMVLPIKTQKRTLASLAGSKRQASIGHVDTKKSSNKTAASAAAASSSPSAACADLCEAMLAQVNSWSAGEMLRHLQQVDDLTERLVVCCWKRLVASDEGGSDNNIIIGKSSSDGSTASSSDRNRAIARLVTARHECCRLTAVLHESLSLDEVQRSIDTLALCLAQVTLAQVADGHLEALMDWSCHLIDAHRNAIRVSLRGDNETIDACVTRLDQSLRRVEELSAAIQENQHSLRVAVGKTERITAPREQLYWREPWPLLLGKTSSS